MPDRQTETGDHFFHTLEFMTIRENMKVAIRLLDSITVLLSLYAGSNKPLLIPVIPKIVHKPIFFVIIL